jgi:hypothetical protein
MLMPFSFRTFPMPMQSWQIGCSKSSISLTGSKAFSDLAQEQGTAVDSAADAAT